MGLSEGLGMLRARWAERSMGRKLRQWGAWTTPPPTGAFPSYLHDRGRRWGCAILLQVLSELPQRRPGRRRWLCSAVSILRWWSISQQRKMFSFCKWSPTWLLQTSLNHLGNLTTDLFLPLPHNPYVSCPKSCLQRWMLFLRREKKSTVFFSKE